MGNTSLGDEAADSSASASNADDLLAQLAGDEIDRLLSDAEEKADAINAGGDPQEAASAEGADAAVAVATPEIDEHAVVSSASDAASAEAAAVAPAVLAALDAPVAVPVAAPVPVPAPVPAPQAKATELPAATDAVAEETDSALAGELDKLFDELKKDPAPDVADAPAPLAAAEPVAVKEDAASDETSTVAIDDATTAEERGGLIVDEAEEDAGDEQTVMIEEKLPIYLRPLELINAPFSFLPDRARDLLGTIAIVTLMNAVAILAYVRFLRKH